MNNPYRIKQFSGDNAEFKINEWLIAHPGYKPISIDVSKEGYIILYEIGRLSSIVEEVPKLKTLKDITGRVHNTTIDVAIIGDLKKEAINWLKEMKRVGGYLDQVSWWIKHFFNIMEEDVREVKRMELEKKLIGNTDARVWAKEFVKVVKRKPEIIIDEQTMLGWFANAIESGRGFK